MAYNYILSCESTIDMPFSYTVKRDISVLFYSYMMDGIEYEDDMLRDEKALDAFYRRIDEGKMPSTSQINEYRYAEYFTELLKKGDVLHIAFGSGMTPSVVNAKNAAKKLETKFPDRKLIVVDSLCSSSGYGLLVDEAADMRDKGASMEKVAEWTLSKNESIHHSFFSTDFTMFRRSGRVSGAAAVLGTILGICPLMHLNLAGKIVAYGKTRGKKAAVKAVVREMTEHAENGCGYSGKCFISHSHCSEEAEMTKLAIEEAFPNVKAQIFEIGTIIASHCGKGTVAVFFHGDQRTE
ncbi:MAG: DegV family protein [Clostridia bacterium]|nr:DegV family protein [Clostridia bacterium]